MTLRATAVLLTMLLGVGAPAIAPGPAPAAAAGPRRVCRIGDDRLTEISGLAATSSGYTVVNDGSDDPAHRKIFFLDRRCSVVRTVSYPSRPRDTEDLAYAADGTLWVADIGDNGLTRTTIALWQLAPGSRTPRLYRLAYPDGAHDAEALLLTATGTPIVVTKAAVTAALYVPTTALRAARTTPLRRAGTVTVPVTGTSNPFSLPGRLVITGGAVSPDGRRAILRTYADAFEFDVPGEDLVRAITEGTPRVIPLPDEPQGESITYSTDGSAALTVSEVAGQPTGTAADLLRYPLPDRPAPTSPAAPNAVAASSSPAPPAAARPAAAVDRRGGIPAGALVTVAVLAIAAAWLGVATVRRRRR
jgi:hypothetical protein